MILISGLVCTDIYVQHRHTDMYTHIRKSEVCFSWTSLHSTATHLCSDWPHEVRHVVFPYGVISALKKILHPSGLWCFGWGMFNL